MKYDGGPVFPKSRTENGLDREVQTGMSLRDYFAGQALTVLRLTDDQPNLYEAAAIQAYKYADAMLKERQ